jgi:subtilisin family serine protease
MAVSGRQWVIVVAVTALVAGPAGPAGAAPVGEIRDAGGLGTVPGSYVVVLKPAGSDVWGLARDLAGRYGGRVRYTYTRALRGFAVEASESAVRRLAADPAVAYVQRDAVYRATGMQPNPPSWGLDRVDQRDLPLNGSFTFPNDAATVHAYVLDTGIRFTHREFAGHVVSGWDTVDGDADASDCGGHGTHVAGTLGGASYGIAKAVRLVGVRVLDCSGYGTTAGVVAGVDWVTANAVRPAVANMSLGGGPDPALETAVQRSIDAGITYAVAAGNGDALGFPQDACGTSPARIPAVLTIGATRADDTRASFSNYGTCLDLFAPGEFIRSAWASGDAATLSVSGTSMAAPHVAGAVALILAQHPDWTPSQVRDDLLARATSGIVVDPRAGSPNELLYIGTDFDPPPPPICSVTHDADTPILDSNEVDIPVRINRCARPASDSATVEVHIRHTCRGDLVVSLLAPDGSPYRLKEASLHDCAADVHATYSINLSAEPATGPWRLRVRDLFLGNTGTLDSWTLTL